tara:strand:- start:10 stop:891 length:882 start_codon:yes stop_codon:yes gene_type:complete
MASRRTTTRTPELDRLRLQLGYQSGFPIDRVGNDRRLLEKYENKFVKRDGTGKLIDERTGEVYNKSAATKYINYWKYGTETPDKLYTVLNKEAELNKKEKTGPWNLRKLLSDRGVGGKKVVELEHAEWLAREREKLKNLVAKGDIDEGEGKGVRLERDRKEANIRNIEEQDRLRGTMSDYEMTHAEQGTFGPSPTWGIGNGFNLNITTNDPNDAPTVGERYDRTTDNPLDDPDYNPQTTRANRDKLKMETAGQSMKTMTERTKAIERAYPSLSKDAKRKLRLRPITQLELEAM